jgi:hypothetical protein
LGEVDDTSILKTARLAPLSSIYPCGQCSRPTAQRAIAQRFSAVALSGHTETDRYLSAFGSKADIDMSASPLKADKVQDVLGCPLSAKSRHTHCSRFSYSITSSAVNKSVGGIVTPSVLAVLRLITRSYLVGCWMGRSPAFSPRRIRSTYDAARRYCSMRSVP